MKKISALLSFIMLAGILFAQQTATPAPTAKPIKAERPISVINTSTTGATSTTASAPAANNTPAPAAGTPCTHGAGKTCTKGEAKPACCQQGGAQGCSGHKAAETAPAKKAE